MKVGIPKLELGNEREKRDRINRDRCGSYITTSYRTTFKRGYVDLAENWRYSSARAYAGKDALLLIVLLYLNTKLSLKVGVPKLELGNETNLLIHTRG